MRPPVPDQDIRRRDFCQSGVAIRRILQIEKDTLLVAIAARPGRAELMLLMAKAPERISAFRLDLEDVGTEIGKLQACERPGQVRGCLHNFDAAERPTIERPR